MDNVERGFVSLAQSEDWTQSNIIKRFDNMVRNVNDMINKNGPIYSTWIRIQLGINDPIIFDTSSNDTKKNLITTLHIDKGRSGVADTFTLTVQYDPFNYGQDTKVKIESLDDFVANAMYVDWNSDDEETKMRGILQYGYNSTNNGDHLLVSPKYDFLLTKAESTIEYSSGIGTYTFEGVSTICAGSDFKADLTKIQGWKPLDIVIWTLFYYYGDAEHIPNGLAADSKPSAAASKYKYRIDVPQWLVDDQPEEINVDAKTMNVWQYCTEILERNPLTKTNKESGLYNDLANLNPNERPSYYMYVTEEEGYKTIHITHNTPKQSEKNDKIEYEFTWSKQDQNIITSWKPEANLYVYMLSKFNYLSTKDNVDINKIKEQESQNSNVLESWEDRMTRISQEQLIELYDSTMTTIGIPADAPVTAEIRVIPTILESVSRTAGVYIIKSASDDISTSGLFTTTFKLFRIRGLNEQDAVPAKTQAQSNQFIGPTKDERIQYLESLENLPSSRTGSASDGGYTGGGGAGGGGGGW